MVWPSSTEDSDKIKAFCYNQTPSWESRLLAQTGTRAISGWLDSDPAGGGDPWEFFFVDDEGTRHQLDLIAQQFIVTTPGRNIRSW